MQHAIQTVCVGGDLMDETLNDLLKAEHVQLPMEDVRLLKELNGDKDWVSQNVPQLDGVSMDVSVRSQCLD